MSDFCSNCSPEGFDINIEKLAKRVKKGFVLTLGEICEGCGLYAIEKSEEGKVLLHKFRKKEHEEFVPSSIENKDSNNLFRHLDVRAKSTF